MKNYLSSFKGLPLSKEQIAYGANLSFLNTQELIEEAELLYKRNSPRAISLAILALEDLAKIPLLFNCLFYKSDDKEKWDEFWDQFKKHPSKQLVWSSYGHLMSKILKKSPYSNIYKPDMVPLIDRLKLSGLYVDFTRISKSFVSPQGFVKENQFWIDFILQFTRERVDSFKMVHETFSDSYFLAGQTLKYYTPPVVLGKTILIQITKEAKDETRQYTQEKEILKTQAQKRKFEKTRHGTKENILIGGLKILRENLGNIPKTKLAVYVVSNEIPIINKPLLSLGDPTFNYGYVEDIKPIEYPYFSVKTDDSNNEWFGVRVDPGSDHHTMIYMEGEEEPKK